jgi:hypothetical protein
MDHEIPTNKCKVTIYGSVTIENGAIMHATNSYYGSPWFSTISVRMNSDELHDYTSDHGICYGQVLINYFNLFNSKYLYDLLNFLKF